MQGFIPPELVANEVNWFYSNLGIDDTYFQNEARQVICDHIIALFGAKILAYTKHDPSKLVIDLEKIDENGATFIHTSKPGLTTTEGPGATCESRSVSLANFSAYMRSFCISERAMLGADVLILESIRCSSIIPRQIKPTDWRLSALPDLFLLPLLSSYVAISSQNVFSQRSVRVLRIANGKTEIRSVSDKAFLEKASENTIQIYQQVNSSLVELLRSH